MSEQNRSSYLVRSLPRHGDRQYFSWFAAFAAMLVFAGFSRTYFLHRFFHVPDLSLFIHIHAVVMAGWILLFVLQTFLINWNRTAWHRALGYFGAGYAALVVVMGCSATFLSARREVRAHSTAAPSFLTVLALELTQMSLFATFVVLAVYYKNRGSYHKRLMVLATICMLPNPMVRLLVLAGVVHNIQLLSVFALGVATIIAIDVIKTRTFHPAFAVGAPAIVGCLYMAYFLSNTHWWQSTATRVVS